MHRKHGHNGSCGPVVVHHRMVCQHRIEVEVWPASAETYFQDERYADPLNTQVRFSASVYNAPTSYVTWQVLDLNGGPGAGAIDAAGLYTAPLKTDPVKGAYPYSLTDIVVAASVDNPTRKAYARVTVIGPGPEPKPEAKIEIYPKQAYLYYPYPKSDYTSHKYNDHIDASNKMQFFRASIRNVPPEDVTWHVNGSQKKSGPDQWYLFDLAGEGYNSGGDGTTLKVTARLSSDWSIVDEAVVVLENYFWPELELPIK